MAQGVSRWDDGHGGCPNGHLTRGTASGDVSATCSSMCTRNTTQFQQPRKIFKHSLIRLQKLAGRSWRRGSSLDGVTVASRKRSAVDAVIHTAARRLQGSRLESVPHCASRPMTKTLGFSLPGCRPLLPIIIILVPRCPLFRCPGRWNPGCSAQGGAPRQIVDTGGLTKDQLA